MPLLPWALLVGLYFPIFELLYRIRWWNLDYTHAYFILPVSLFLVWNNRQVLAKRVSNTGSLLYAGILALGLALFFVGWQFQYAFVETLSLLPVLAGLVGYLYGGAVLRAAAFPICYLLFLVPPPMGVLDTFTLPMRSGVSFATEKILLALHYPVTRSGLLLSIGGNDVYLGEACSGFRSLVTFGALGSAYIYTMNIPLKKKWLLGASIVPFALLGNLVRVASVCLVTYYLGVSKGQHYYHDASGFVIFLILIAGLLGFEKMLKK